MLVAAALALAGASAALAGDDGSTGEPLAFSARDRVFVYDNFFEPRSLTVSRRETVVWQWRGDNRHNISFTKVPRKARRTGAEARRNGRWARKFVRRGLYKYVCTLHQGMSGSILVR